mgnify:CR=1 FL=1
MLPLLFQRSTSPEGADIRAASYLGIPGDDPGGRVLVGDNRTGCSVHPQAAQQPVDEHPGFSVLGFPGLGFLVGAEFAGLVRKW